MQGSLFTAPVSPRKSVFSQRDQILKQHEKAAGQLFMRDASQEALRLLTTRDMTSEELTQAIKAAGVLPPCGKSDRVFGAVYMTLAKRKRIKKAAPSGSIPRAKGNGAAGGNLWRLA